MSRVLPNLFGFSLRFVHRVLDSYLPQYYVESRICLVALKLAFWHISKVQNHLRKLARVQNIVLATISRFYHTAQHSLEEVV